MRAPLLSKSLCPTVLAVAALVDALAAGHATVMSPAEIYKRAQQEKPALIDTTKTLVSIGLDSRDIEGLDKIVGVVVERLCGMGGDVKLIDPSDHAYRMINTPEKIGKMMLACFKGGGRHNTILITHMDTVYLKGMLAQQPFRIDGDHAYGLGIIDGKNGAAVTLYTVSILQAINLKRCDTLTVLISGDERIGSPGVRAIQTKLGAERDVVFSYGDTRVMPDKLSLATSGTDTTLSDIENKISHIDGVPEQGCDALHELSHQMFQMRNLFRPEVGPKVNWTAAQAGTNRNVIPVVTTTQADVRLLRAADADKLEETANERVKNRLISDTQVTAGLERCRPSLEATSASHMLAEHARKIYGELDGTLEIDDEAEGGDTDVAFAVSKIKAPMIERFRLANSGTHSDGAEYVGLNSIVPRLYLLMRMIMDVSYDHVDLTKQLHYNTAHKFYMRRGTSPA